MEPFHLAHLLVLAMWRDVVITEVLWCGRRKERVSVVVVQTANSSSTTGHDVSAEVFELTSVDPVAARWSNACQRGEMPLASSRHQDGMK
jgi:hypothetical protein